MAEGRLADQDAIELILTKDTDRRLTEIAEANLATSIRLTRTDVTAEGVAKLQAMTRLRNLYIDEPALGRDVLPMLSEMESLRELGVGRMELRPEDFEQFNDVPFLRELWCDLSELPRDEQRALKEKYPFLRIGKGERPFR